MFGKLFKKKAPMVSASLRLNARIMPMTRGEIFEDPLDEVLQAAGLGEVSGGGTGLDDEGSPAFCDVDIELTDTGESVVTTLVDSINELGAPKGSKLELPGRVIPVGNYEGLLIAFEDGELAGQFAERLMSGESPHVFGESGGRGHYKLHLYGPSFEEMRATVEKVSAQEPFIPFTRIEQIA